MKSNIIRLHKTNGTVLLVNKIDGFIIEFTGNDSVVELYEPLPTITNCYCKLASNCSITIQSSRYYLNGLCIHQNADFSKLTIGENFSCNPTRILYDEPAQSITIGSGCMFASNIMVRISDAHSIIDMTTGKVLNSGKSIHIGNNVWIANDCTILKGVQIMDNCVIGTRSLVTKPIEQSHALIAGSPAKVKKTNIFWDRSAPHKFNVYANESHSIMCEELSSPITITEQTTLLNIDSIDIESNPSIWNGKTFFSTFEPYCQYLLSIDKISQISGNPINYCHLSFKDMVKNTGIYIHNLIFNKNYTFLIKTKDIVNPIELKIYAGVAGQTSNIAINISGFSFSKIKLNNENREK